jgi:hypothetical protein
MYKAWTVPRRCHTAMLIKADGRPAVSRARANAEAKEATEARRSSRAGRPRKDPLPAGWKPGRRFVPHLRRVAIDHRKPAHVTMRLLPVVRTLRNGKLYDAVHRALGAGSERDGFRLVHFSVQRDHPCTSSSRRTTGVASRVACKASRSGSPSN